ncbi:MAG: acylphosphatase [Epsilonproteobacteria bacterium]|nr:acylphosphatase [Campylobacterota bacterium]
MNQIVSYRLKILGNVQKVGYRNWMRETAIETGIAGWVKNCPDSSVEALIEGNENAINRIIESCGKGPTFATVKLVVKRKVNFEGCKNFIIK